MNKIMIVLILALTFCCCKTTEDASQDTTHANNGPQLAFPTAEGYGKYSKGGRGGDVYLVTNLNDSGEGSLRAAIEASGPRTVIFRVSGTIELNKPLRIRNPYITIAGQTAPGDGICIRKYPLSIDADHVIIRYIRVRFGDESGSDSDAISSRYVKHLIVDHVSASWSLDEAVSIYHCDSLTVQWSIMSESLYDSGHTKGTHGYGGIWGANNSSYHHNLFAHHTSRTPRMASGSGFTDYRNNVIYNWGFNSMYGGENKEVGNPKFSFSSFNVVGNYYKPGPATRPGKVSYRIVNPSYRNDPSDFGKWYVTGNVMEGNKEVTANNWNGGVQPSDGEKNIQYVKAEKPWESMPIKEQSAEEAFIDVLKYAGATLPKRDEVDTRIIEETRGGYATYEGASYKERNEVRDTSKITGIIDTQNDVGGWPILKSAPAPIDTDGDGMPDEWEKKNGLYPNDPNDRNKVGRDGYTMLEKYLNSI